MTLDRGALVAAIEAGLDARLDAAMPEWGPDTREWAEDIADRIAPARSWLLTLPFERPPVTANDARNTAGWRAESAGKRLVAQAVVVAVRQAQVPALARCAVTVTWHAPDRQTRDSDGLGPFAKAAIDALTPPRDAVPKGTPLKSGKGVRQKAAPAKLGAGIIADDHAGIVEAVTLRIVQASPPARLELLIVALD